ncbi:MAG TPA: helix-turn-helix transcriptional regulator [Usitatibacter sp.]|nr:helix-turn-helix transcriptional regulator [Usitatibacter sp.]
MGRRIDDVIAKLPKERRKAVAKKANEMAKEMIAHADSLRVVRKALSKTQTKIGEDLGLSQNAVSQLEGRSDLLLSTLRRYVRALGADLDLVVRMKDGSKVLLEGLGQSAEHRGRMKPDSGVKRAAKRRGRGSESRSNA